MLFRAVFLFVMLHMTDGHTHVRLVGGPTPSEGRVELYHNGSWGTICNDGWDIDDAQVICRMLHYINASETYVSGIAGQGDGIIWFNDVQCNGTEESIDDCPHAPWGQHDCLHSEDVSVKCFSGVRIVGGTSRYEGRAEIYYNGTWGTICDRGWDVADAEVFCNMLGFVGASEAPNGSRFGAGSGTVWLENVNCTGNETRIRQCSISGWGDSSCDHSRDASVVCEPHVTDVRLVGGTWPGEGRVEIERRGVWGTICDDYWELPDARVVCRMLGYRTAIRSPTRAYFGRGNGTIWLDDVFCTGNESSLEECAHAGWKNHDCTHQEDASVICFPDTSTLAGRILNTVSEIEQSIFSAVPYWFDYDLSYSNYYIWDGGQNMFNYGNQIFIVPELHQPAEWSVAYGRSYSDNATSFICSAFTPFMCFMAISNDNCTMDKFSIRVRGYLGARGLGEMKAHGGVVQGDNLFISYEVVQVFGTASPSVAELYFTISENNSTSGNLSLDISRSGLYFMNNEATVSDCPENITFGYMLLSSWQRMGWSGTGLEIDSMVIINILRLVARSLYGPDISLPVSTVELRHNVSVPTPTTTTVATTTTLAPTTSNTSADLLLECLSAQSSNLTSAIPNFYYYRYDGGVRQINDGGLDMYDGGNIIYISSPDRDMNRLDYNASYQFDDYSVASTMTHPFLATAVFDGNMTDSFSFTVESNTGADGSGSLVYYSSSADSWPYRVSFQAVQVYGTSDPSILEIYVFVADMRGGIPTMQRTTMTTSTDYVDTNVTLTGNLEGSAFIYALASSEGNSTSEMTGIQEVANFVNILVSCKTGQTFPDLSNGTVEVEDFAISTTPVTPTTPPEGPTGTPVLDALRRIEKTTEISRDLSEFFFYIYDDFYDYQIRDGGNDMYDGGNMVYYGRSYYYTSYRLRYGRHYRYGGSFEISSTKSHPFVTLMHINNTMKNGRYSTFSLRVRSNAGADGRGSRVHFSGDSSHFGKNVVYTVTQVYGAHDPTICEVYFAVSDYQLVANYFSRSYGYSSTDSLDTTVRVRGYPTDVWLGYALLSRVNGLPIQQAEVENAVSSLVAAIYNIRFPFKFPFDPSPLLPLPTFRAYSGVVESVCGEVRLSRYHRVDCRYDQRALYVDMTVAVPTTIGYDNIVQGIIMKCVPEEVCDQSCYTMYDSSDFRVQWCSSRCCSYDYCNYPRTYYYGYYYHPITYPENVTIDEELLPTLPVEILPNCTFRDVWAEMVPCGQHIFDNWPFSDSSECETSFINAMMCELKTVYACQSDELFTSAMWPLPTHFNLTDLVLATRQSGALDLVCHTPLSHIFDVAFGLTLGSNDTGNPGFNRTTYSPESLLSELDGTFGWLVPMCDDFILHSIFEWLMELVPAFRGTDRVAMCRSLKGTVNKIIDAGKTRCDVDALISFLPCDSVLRNQYRAFFVQILDELPDIIPDFCRDVEAPDEEDKVEDIPFLPSCTLREALNSVWVCERVFTKHLPYTDGDSCKSNVNKLMHCVANRLQKCGNGQGRNVLEELFPYIRFEDMLSMIRGQAMAYSAYTLSRVCNNADISLWTFTYNVDFLGKACQRGVLTEIVRKFQQTYYQYAGAMNSAEVCMAFQEFRDWTYETVTNRCELYALRFLAPQYSLFDVISNALQIATDLLPGLTISSCPEMIVSSGNVSFSATDWLKSYIRWRMNSLPEWQADFENWRNSCGMKEAVQMPACVELTSIRCRNPAMKACVNDYYKCPLCYCQDHKYIGLNNAVLEPWMQDWKNWEDFEQKWQDEYMEWKDGTEGC